MRDDVEGDLLGELLRLDRIADEDRAALLEQLVHARLARAGDRLVGAHHHALDRRGIVERLQGHHQLRGRAVGVGDDVARCIAIDRVGVHFRHDQRHVGVHAVERRVVDHDATGGGRLGGIFLGRARACREQGDIPAGEIEMLDVLALEHLAGVAEFDFRAGRTRRGDRGDFVAREIALGEDLHHFAPDIAGRADHCHPVTHLAFSYHFAAAR